MSGRRLVVWQGQRRVGELIQDAQGALQFAYGADWLEDPAARPISMSLPKQPKAFPDRACRPFFDGLLPEGTPRRAVAQALGISERNPFALLDALGGDVAGALEFLPPGQEPEAPASPATPKPLDDADLDALLDRLPLRPLLAGEGGLRLSLAGAQAKLPVCLTDGLISLPAPGQPTTHILKPAIPALPASTENEAFAMLLAAELGLPVAPVEARSIPRPAGPRRTFLLVTRYDRAFVDGQVRRIHQEDVCQALGIPSQMKYQSEGGPSLAHCFTLVQAASTLPAVDRLSLLDLVIVNAILGNADAHGKNLSLLHVDGGTRLAPFYDLMSTEFYPALSKTFAMKIGGASQARRLGPRAWAEFAGQASLALPFVRRRILALAERIPEATEAVLARLDRPGLDVESLRSLAELVKARAVRIAAGVSHPGQG
jgi:serine/threonine-protein kinase HipA